MGASRHLGLLRPGQVLPPHVFTWINLHGYTAIRFSVEKKTLNVWYLVKHLSTALLSNNSFYRKLFSINLFSLHYFSASRHPNHMKRPGSRGMLGQDTYVTRSVRLGRAWRRASR